MMVGRKTLNTPPQKKTHYHRPNRRQRPGRPLMRVQNGYSREAETSHLLALL